MLCSCQCQLQRTNSQIVFLTMIAAIAAAAAFGCRGEAQRNKEDGTPVFRYEVVSTYPHDATAFTEGLLYFDGFFYESTGLADSSSLRKVPLKMGEVTLSRSGLSYFGEGLSRWNDRLYQLSWRDHTGFIYDAATLQPRGEFRYRGEGWGLTNDGRRFIMSDGTEQLRFLDLQTLQEEGSLTVTAADKPVKNLNELEWVNGEILANVWKTDRIARIDPESGRVTGWIDLSGLWSGSDNVRKTLNGIAYDSVHDRLFVTGKMWPNIFEIRITKGGRPAS